MSTWQYVLLNLMGAACLTIAGFALVTQQQADALQQEAAKRQKLIEKGVELSKINTGLIKALAAESLDSGDRRLGEILSEQGISYTAAQTGANDG